MLISGTVTAVLFALYCGAYGISMLRQKHKGPGIAALALAVIDIAVAVSLTIV